jgi:hypothetical protein
MRAQMHILRDIIYGISARGADIKEVCDELGIAPAQLKDAEQWASYKAAAEVWNVAIHHTDDPLIGLHLGEELTPAILGIIGYLMQSSTNLGEAFGMISKYNDLYSTMMKFYSRESKDLVSLCFEPALRWQLEYKESARQSVEMSMSGVLKIFKMLSGKTIVPVQVDLAFLPRRTNEYARIFKSAVKFKARENRLIFQKHDLLQDVISHDKSLFTFFNSTLEQKLKNIDESVKMRHRFR